MRKKEYIQRLNHCDERFCYIMKNCHHMSREQALEILSKNRLLSYEKQGLVRRLHFIYHSRQKSAIELTDKGNGEYTFKMPATKVNVETTFVEDTPIEETTTEDNTMINFFVDIPDDAYYYDAVLWAAKNGITGGMDDTHFAPDITCTRVQAITFLWRAAGSPMPKSSEISFEDVETDSYYYYAVLWALENGITSGTSATTFSPDDTCSRGQIVTFLWRSEKSPTVGMDNTFTDVSSDFYYADATNWAVANGITNGTSDTTFSPDETCTRGQIVTLLYRLFVK